MFCPSFVMHYLVSFLVLQIILTLDACFTLIFLLMFGDCQWSLPLPHGAVGWSAVCDCGNSRSYSFTFLSRHPDI